MSHEKSITIKTGGKFVNIPSVIDGRQLSEREAVEAFRKGKIKPLGGKKFDTVEEAVEAAKERSEGFNEAASGLAEELKRNRRRK